MDEAHRRRLVHRDLKPANVMLTTQGHVKVMDFGLAKALSDGAALAPLTGSGVRLGTPGYMAPEQLHGADTDTRSDIFAFGIVLYEMLAGVHPYRHFDTALNQAHDFPDKIAQPETRRWYAWMLLDRDGPGDREKARTLLGEAIELYRTIGMPKHVEIAEKMLHS
jgi:serine/threonine protein kinase